MNEIKESCSEEYHLLNDMKILSQKIMEESSNEFYNQDSFKDLMSKLILCLSNKRQVMSYEFKQSGLLRTLECLLTKTPKEVQRLIVEEEAREKGEEIKDSEKNQFEMAGVAGKKKLIRKKEARAYL